jgi:hypothetical protein
VGRLFVLTRRGSWGACIARGYLNGDRVPVDVGG